MEKIDHYKKVNDLMSQAIDGAIEGTMPLKTVNAVTRSSATIVRNMTAKLKSDEQHHIEVEDPYFKNN